MTSTSRYSETFLIRGKELTFYKYYNHQLRLVWKCILCNKFPREMEIHADDIHLWSTSQDINGEIDIEKNPEIKNFGTYCKEYGGVINQIQYDRDLQGECQEEIGEKLSIKYHIVCNGCFNNVLRNDKITPEQKAEKLESGITQISASMKFKNLILESALNVALEKSLNVAPRNAPNVALNKSLNYS